ncbi:Ada3 domain-containing protein [Sporobolomyces salmoneus]|uniref:Ada3 domain-containing protein n=1 Tax=Sporobolomyces salmoneus TaxID=183962 RepID=UPI00317B8126
MPNPPTPAPPPASLPILASAVPSSSSSSSSLLPSLPALTKFPLHTPANASSPLITCSSSTGPLPNQTLLNLRTVLVASRFSASSRVQLKEENKKLLLERQVSEKKSLEEAGRIKEGERRRKREEEEKREKERVEKVERERLEQRQREERELAVRRQVEEREEEERRRLEREKEQAQIEAQRQQQAAAKKSQKTATKGQAMKSTAPAAANGTDTMMKDATTVQPPLQGKSPLSRIHMYHLQPKPPRHYDKKKKRKRDTVIDSDDSGTDSTPAPEQPLLQKIRKLESTNSHQPSPSSASTPATPGPATPSARHSPLPPTNAPPPPVISTPRLNPLERRLKSERFTKHSIPIKPPAPGSATAFYVPQYSLVPVKPEVVPPTPTAKRQADVEGDFSNSKPGQQIAHSTFVNWTESYLRPFGEDDLAFLAAKPEDLSPYIIPPLGKPYLQKWEEEDLDHHRSSSHSHQQKTLLQQQQQRLLHSSSSSSNASTNAALLLPPPLPRLKPCHLSEEAMATENIFLGPLSERIMSALAFEESVNLGLLDGSGNGNGREGSVEGDEEENGFRGGGRDGDDEDAEGEDDMEDGMAGMASAGEKVEMDAVDLEERIKRELRFIGLLPEEEVDWTKREDDEISTALRACQRLLQHQVELNESRKSILMSIVKDRMAYQEYETARDAQERVIEAGWHKRQRTDSKKKKKGTQKDKDRSLNKVPSSAGVGGEEDPSKVPVSPVLLEAVEKRNALVESFKPFFEEDGGKSRWWGIPDTSVYEGMLESIEEEDDNEEVG